VIYQQISHSSTNVMTPSQPIGLIIKDKNISILLFNLIRKPCKRPLLVTNGSLELVMMSVTVKSCLELRDNLMIVNIKLRMKECGLIKFKSMLVKPRVATTAISPDSKFLHPRESLWKTLKVESLGNSFQIWRTTDSLSTNYSQT